jgi:hypothetical protein
MLDPSQPAPASRPRRKKLMRAPRFIILPDVHPLVRGRLNLLGGALDTGRPDWLPDA